MTAPRTLVPKRRLSGAIDRARAAGRAALIGYLPAGYPTLEDSAVALRTLSWHVDVLEVGLPFSKASLDGPDIHRASQTALAAGATPAAVIEIIREVAATSSVPITLMSYWEPIARIGPEAVAAAVTSAGAAGVVLPDLHPAGRGAARWLAAANRHGLATTFLASTGQLPDAAANSTGWVYLPATSSLTGTHAVVDLSNLHRRTGQLRHLTRAPICTGIGISSPELAAAIAPGVDGVVIGSALVRALQKTPGARASFGRLDDRAGRYAAALRMVPGSRSLPAAS
jgi:tryptophan synthase alpha chain